MDAEIDRGEFVDQFAANFEESFGAICIEKSNSALRFSPSNTNFSDLYMELTFMEEFIDDKIVTTVHVTTKTRYKFKTKFLKQADAAGLSAGPCFVKCDNTYVISIRN